MLVAAARAAEGSAAAGWAAAGSTIEIIRFGCHATRYHVDALVVGGHIGVRREVFGKRNGAPLHACDAIKAYGGNRVEVERVDIGAAVVRAIPVVGIGFWDVIRRDAVSTARYSEDATFLHCGGRVEVGRRRVGAPEDGESAATVIRVRSRQIVGRPGVGAAKNGVDALISGPWVVYIRISPVVGRFRVPAPVTY